MMPRSYPKIILNQTHIFMSSNFPRLLTSARSSIVVPEFLPFPEEFPLDHSGLLLRVFVFTSVSTFQPP
jgi:hypothetical protein